MDKMDEQHRRAAELLEQLNLVNAEIAKEEGQLQPNSEPKPAPEPKAQVAEQPADTPQAIATPPSPPVESAKPTSGVLCNWPVEVPQNGEVKFRNLPSDRLRFTFDHDAWMPLIRREPDGTRTLIMRSLKPGVQTMCDIRWEVVQ
jgi:hypothetical protein